MRRCCRHAGVTVCLLWLSSLGMTSASAQTPPQVNPAQWEPQITKFVEADQKTPPVPGGVLFVGSSSIVRWDLPKAFPGLDAVNRGFGGSNLSDTVHFFERIVVPHRPRTIVVYAGDNDLGKGFSAEAVAEQFHLLLEKRKKSLPDSQLIFIGIKPSIKRWNLIEPLRKANSLIQAECEATPLTTFVDIDKPMIGEDGKPQTDLYAADGLHLSEKGYSLWNDLLRPLVTKDSRLGRKRGIYDPYHPWTPPATLEEWKVEQERIRHQILVACGLWPMPEREPLEATIHGRADFGDYTIEKVFFTTAPGVCVTGELFRPKKIDGKAPAVLCPHGHWPDGRFYDASAGEAQNSINTGGEQFLSGARSPMQARAVQLARMGCVTFFYDMIGYADQGPLPHRGGAFADAKASLWLQNKLGLQTWNSIRALDFVTSLPDVDPARIGVTGASGGGTQTMLLCAIDPRPTVSFPAVMVSTGMQGGCICENSDLLRIGLNNVAIAAAFAPRPQSMSGADDWTIHIETRGLPELKHVYGLYGAADKVDARCFPQFMHNYNQVSREVMFDWFNTHLKLDLTAPVKQTDFWPRSKDQQTVFDAGHPRPAAALTEAGVREQMQKRDEQWMQTISTGSADQFKKNLRPAIDILLPTAKGNVSVTETGTRSPEGSSYDILELTVTSGQMHIPTLLLRPKAETDKVVLWLDGAGSRHLLNENGTAEASIEELLKQGVAVASADLLLTGSTANEPNPYVAKLKTPSPSHEPAVAGEDYTGFLYGYNLPLLSERVNDIDRVRQALAERGFKQIHLVGTGNAGIWALLARSRWTPQQIISTTVDLNGFRFGAITSALDENLLPGALKYGGVGGIAALAFPAGMTIAGAGDVTDPELAPLRRIYGEKGAAILKTESLSRTEIAKQFQAGAAP